MAETKKNSKTIESMDRPSMLSVAEFAKRLGLKMSTAYKMLAHEPGVLRIHIPGSNRPIIRVPGTIVDRILLRSVIKGRSAT